MTEHEKWMTLACLEAEKGFGQTSPNPLVGAIAVGNSKVLSSGYHHRAGSGHAEVNCLQDNIDYSNATLYVTLEPCSTHGRTPPCTEKIIQSGITNVIIGNLDPNPAHAGKAISILQKAGISVTHNVLKEKCWKINLPFYKWIQTGTPFVHLKMAMTLDGKIATENGHSKWITGPEAREEVQKMRQRCDAIMVGGETIRQDNSSLTVQRNPWTQPQRYIWSSQQNWDQNLKVFQDEDHKKARLCKPINALSWEKLLKEMGSNETTCLLLEGGGELAANALNAGVVDQVSFFIAPKILTGKNSRPVTAGPSPTSLNEALNLQNIQTKNFGNDILIEGYLSDIWQFN